MYLYYNEFFQFLIIILFIFITYCVYNKYYRNEKFDQKVTRSSKENCGIMCTKVFGCKGFAVDGNNSCFLSKSLIIGRPEQSVFSTEYNRAYTRCNKIKPVEDPVIATNLDLRNNATYVCNDGETSNQKSFKFYDTKEKTLKTLEENNKIPMNNYTFEEIEWGNSIELDDNKYLITNPTKSNSIYGMIEHDEEYLGQYVYPHKCSANISLKNCLRDCLKNKDCVGTEWNPSYFKQTNSKSNDEYDLYKGVCCPKRKIREVVQRRKPFSFGKFYLKKIIYKDDQKTLDGYVSFS